MRKREQTNDEFKKNRACTQSLRGKSHEVRKKNNDNDDFEWRNKNKKRKELRSACMHKNVLFKMPYAILLKHFKHAKWPFVPLTSLVVSISKKKKRVKILIYCLLYSFNSHSTEYADWLKICGFQPIIWSSI